MSDHPIEMQTGFPAPPAPGSPEWLEARIAEHENARAQAQANANAHTGAIEAYRRLLGELKD